MSTENKLHAWIALILGFTVCLGTLAEPDKKPTSQSDQAPVYKPPKRGAPKTRIGGGTRGGDGQVILSVLAPEHTGWVSKAQPILYWYISQPTDTERELIVYDGIAVKPLLAVRNSGPILAGMHALQLGDHQIQLQPDIEYEWSVSLTQNPQQPSKNRVTSATLVYVKAPVELATKVANAQPTLAAKVWADQGYWYDAMESLSSQLEQNPNDRVLKQYRAALLNQVGLTGVAAYDQP